jgi:hypothetical protein
MALSYWPCFRIESGFSMGSNVPQCDRVTDVDGKRGGSGQHEGGQGGGESGIGEVRHVAVDAGEFGMLPIL